MKIEEDEMARLSQAAILSKLQTKERKWLTT